MSGALEVFGSVLGGTQGVQQKYAKDVQSERVEARAQSKASREEEQYQLAMEEMRNGKMTKESLWKEIEEIPAFADGFKKAGGRRGTYKTTEDLAEAIATYTTQQGVVDKYGEDKIQVDLRNSKNFNTSHSFLKKGDKETADRSRLESNKESALKKYSNAPDMVTQQDLSKDANVFAKEGTEDVMKMALSAKDKLKNNTQRARIVKGGSKDTKSILGTLNSEIKVNRKAVNDLKRLKIEEDMRPEHEQEIKEAEAELRKAQEARTIYMEDNKDDPYVDAVIRGGIQSHQKDLYSEREQKQPIDYQPNENTYRTEFITAPNKNPYRAEFVTAPNMEQPTQPIVKKTTIKTYTPDQLKKRIPQMERMYKLQPTPQLKVYIDKLKSQL